MAYSEKRTWENQHYPTISEDEILLHLIKFINSRNFESKKWEIDYFWDKELEDAKKLPEGYLKHGAVKEVTAIIEHNKQEIVTTNPSKDELRHIARRLYDCISMDMDEVGAYEAKHIIFSFLNHNPKVMAWCTDSEKEAMKMVSVKIFHDLFFTLRLLRQQKQGRFIELDTFNKNTLRNKQSRIKTIKETLQIAKIYNNHHLINECKTMIEQIEKEDLISEATIFKSLFWSIHRLLIANSPIIQGTAYKPLSFDAKNGINNNSATKTTNYLIKIFMDKETSFIPKKTTVSKRFYENGYNDARELIHYK